MFLGISYDKWHGILAAIIILFIFISGFFTVFPLGSRLIGPGFTILILLLIGIIIASMLQALNESFQALDPDIEEKYGSLKNFQINSKRDWKYFLFGLIVGQIISILFLTVFFLID